jgi:predicted O-methyltransferase YrrM
MRKLILAYIKFWWTSKNQHSVHSPFVYNLITTCFYDKTFYSAYNNLKDYKKYVLNNHSEIDVTDLGAGSQIIKSNIRVVSDIAKNVGTKAKRAKLLFRLTEYFKFKTALELGTSLGIATHAMSLGNSNARITTIEGCPNISKFTQETFKQFNLENIEVLTGNFSDKIETLKLNTYDFVFFDGNHQKEATLNYFELLIETAHNDSVFIFDDIYWSKGMTEAWNTIIKHPEVTVSIDTFFWGFVFFRSEKKKEHFTIRL